MIVEVHAEELKRLKKKETAMILQLMKASKSAISSIRSMHVKKTLANALGELAMTQKLIKNLEKKQD